MQCQQASDVTADEIQYARDIQPILAANCFLCHGADPANREADLRLDMRDAALAGRDVGPAIVPGKPDDSSLMQRILTEDHDLQMPPPDSGKQLSPEQIQLLRRWIEAGAEYQTHWAFLPPQRPPVPAIRSNWIRNPIDAFVLQRLQSRGLSPSPEASAATRLRRLSLDLTGLLPESTDIKAAQHGELRWDTVVEAQLASPHFGEKWGREWLDAARYADSDGFEKDKPRFVWFYRDWVVNSLNRDMPYDEFLIAQLAGDLLPDAGQDELVATGFLRNSMINEEGGVDPEQFRMEAMFDRMDAVGKAMLGLTIQCSQCHNHKYDPLTQNEYYRMFAYLNNCDEAQATVYTREEQQQIIDLQAQISALEEQLRRSNGDWPERMAIWEASRPQSDQAWQVVRPQLDSSGGQKHYLLEDGSVLAQGYAPTRHTTEFTVETDLESLTGFRLELLNDHNLPHGGPGRSIDGLCALSEFQVTVEPRGGGPRQNLKWAMATADVNPERKLLR
ncbi:MAG: DUF1549 domain-containing protein, partial [Planctomycetaceae bacterium]|nr:DUF1549 domain-containing protein [Planctomycetaceae bacterium]